MKHIPLILACLLLLPAYAEKWVTVYDDDEIGLYIDRDSIRQNGDMVEFEVDDDFGFGGPAWADCRKNLLYFIFVMDPGWVSPRDGGDWAMINYVCGRSN